MKFRIILIIVLCGSLAVPAFSGINDMVRVVQDPIDNLIYPQQLVVGPKGNFYILDTISNSSRVKIYSKDGEFVRGLIPAGVGENASRFDPGLTIVSGKNLLSISDDGNIVLLDNEDGWSMVKVFDSEGKLIDSKVPGYILEEDAYGAVCVDSSKIYIEYRDTIQMGEFPLSRKLIRFTGKRGEPIDNWDIATGRLIALVDGDIVVYNERAMPVNSIDISKILNNPLSFDVFDIATSSKSEIAVTGEVIYQDTDPQPFLATISRFKKDSQLTLQPKYITSLDYDQAGNLYGLIVEMKSATISRFTSDLKSINTFSIELNRPALTFPRQVTVLDDNSIILDDQYNSDNYENPFSTEGNMSLVLKRFLNGELESKQEEIEILELGENRFGTVFLDSYEDQIILGGMMVDKKGLPIETPTFSIAGFENSSDVKQLESFNKIVLARLPSDKFEVLATDPVSGIVWESTFDESLNAKPDSEEATNIEGMPTICPINENTGFIQEKMLEWELPPLGKYDLSEPNDSFEFWKPSLYADLRLEYECDDSTAVVYWFPQALIRIDEDFDIVGWIDLMDEAAYDFLDGVYKNNRHYLLEGRYNLVYGFDDSAWNKVETYTHTEVLVAINWIRDFLAIYYSRTNEFPKKLMDIVDANIADELEFADVMEFFLSEDVVFYRGSKFQYHAIVWGKDPDQTLFEVTDKDVREL